MVNKNKITLMTRLALYDKHHGKADRAVFAYYRRDFIYRKNMWTRFCVGIGGVILLAVYWLHRIFIAGEDINVIAVQDMVTVSIRDYITVDIQRGLLDSFLFVVALLAVYTVIGTVQGTAQYYGVQKRLTRYNNMLKHLERMDAPGTAAAANPERTEAPVSDKTITPPPRERRAASPVISDTRTRPIAGLAPKAIKETEDTEETADTDKYNDFKPSKGYEAYMARLKERGREIVTDTKETAKEIIKETAKETEVSDLYYGTPTDSTRRNN
jgi:hypothetical protein